MAFGINNNSQVVGESSTINGTSAFINMQEISTPYGSSAYSINDGGLVVGKLHTGNSWEEHAFLWKQGNIQDLGTLAGGLSSHANSVNSVGQVVGWSNSGADGGRKHALMWSGGELHDLGASGGESEALDINDHGIVVGSSNNHAVIWSGGQMYDLSGFAPPGYVLTEAVSINSFAQIAASDNRHYAFMLGGFKNQVQQLKKSNWNQAVEP